MKPVAIKILFEDGNDTTIANRFGLRAREGLAFVASKFFDTQEPAEEPLGGITTEEATKQLMAHFDELVGRIKSEPPEPLIKDEKVRKAVRAWAEANDIDSSFYHCTVIKFDPSEHRFTWIDTSIEFDDIAGLENLKAHKSYTIAELCGEEE